MKNMKLAIASEHAGFELKEQIISYLREKGYEIDDLGAKSDEPIDYPNIAANLAEKVVTDEYNRGILICGTGIGMSIAAGKVPGARAGLCTNAFMAKLTSEHNNTNILCLGAWITGSKLSFNIVDAYLEAEFTKGRHVNRVNLIEELERKYCSRL